MCKTETTICQTETTDATNFVKLTFANARAQILKTISQMEDEEPMEVVKVEEKEVTAMIMSNDPLMGVRVFCAMCDHEVSLAGLSSHLRSHQVTLSQYTKVYGDPRKEIVTKVHHSCAICCQVMLLNSFDISKHVRKHQLSFTAYAKKFMKRGEGLLPPSTYQKTSSKKISEPKESSKPKRRVSFAEAICAVKLYSPSESPEKVQHAVPYLTLDEDEDISPASVKIECHICFKSFKMNKQLSAHMKRHFDHFSN